MVGAGQPAPEDWESGAALGEKEGSAVSGRETACAQALGGGKRLKFQQGGWGAGLLRALEAKEGNWPCSEGGRKSGGGWCVRPALRPTSAEGARWVCAR